MTPTDEIGEAIVWCKQVNGHKTARLLARLRDQADARGVVAAALRAAADDLDALQTPSNEHYSHRDPALWLHNRASAIERGELACEKRPQ